VYTATKLIKKCMVWNCENRLELTPLKKDPNLYAVCEFFIKPLTKASQVSYAELMKPKGCTIDLFISHYWGEEFAEFCQSTHRFACWFVLQKCRYLVDEEAAIRARQLSFYICAFSNNLWNIEAEMGKSLDETPFHKVIRSPTTQMVVMNVDQLASTFARAWCSFEFFLAVETGKQFCLNSRHGPPEVMYEAGIEAEMALTHLFEVLQVMDIRSCSCSVQEDFDMIHGHLASFKGWGIAEGLGGAEALNRIMKSVVADRVLHVFVKWGSTDKMQDALRLGANPNTLDAHGISSVTYATALHGSDSNQAQVLLQWGGNAEFQTNAAEVVDMFDTNGAKRAAAIVKVEDMDENIRQIYSQAVHCAQREHITRLTRDRLEEMHSIDSRVRQSALESIANEAKLGPKYVDCLAECLGHEDPALRYFAAYALSRPGASAVQYVPLLLDIVENEDEEKGVVLMAERALRTQTGEATIHKDDSRQSVGGTSSMRSSSFAAHHGSMEMVEDFG